MNRLLYTLSLSILLSMTACHHANKKAPQSQEKTVEVLVQDVAEMLKNTEQLLDKDVIFKGWVSHTCVHSGRRCFIKSDDGTVSIRVEASGNINGFNKELTGEHLQITGVLRVNKLSQQYLDDWQAKLEASKSPEELEEGGEHCSAELTNIQEMRNWMKAEGKDYYPIYYVDGTDYEILEVKE